MKREVFVKPKFRWLGLVAVALGVLPIATQGLTSDAHDAVLRKLSCAAGDRVPVAVEVAVPGAVALQLDLEFDPAMLALDEVSGTTVEIAPGQTMSVYHLSQGRARLVVFGRDLASLPQGRLGDVRFRALQATVEEPIMAMRRTVSDRSGRALATQMNDGVIVAVEEVGNE